MKVFDRRVVVNNNTNFKGNLYGLFSDEFQYRTGCEFVKFNYLTNLVPYDGEMTNENYRTHNVRIGYLDIPTHTYLQAFYTF